MKRELPYAGEHWFKLLQEALDGELPGGRKNSITAIAAKIGYSRPALSQIVNGIYIGRPDAIAAAVLAHLGRRQCPYLQTEIGADDCRAVWLAATPSHDHASLAHRRMCRTCRHNERENRNG